jgi:HAD superfamily hydrolase (TIGR01509 family)
MEPPAGPVLFDMDGVLVDSETYWNRFESAWVFETAVASGSPTHAEITGMSFRESYDYLAAEYGTAVSKEAFVAKYEERAESLYGEDVDLTPGTRALFEDLRAAGRAVGIVSSSPRSWIDAVRERFDLDPLDLVVSANDIDGPGKPDPDIYEYAAAELGVAPSTCVVVEDSPNGIAAAVEAGAFTVAYRSTHNAELDLSDADTVVESPGTLRSRLLG